MTARRRFLPALALAGFLAGCAGGEASDDGTALLTNTSDRDDLRVVVLDGDGQPFREAALDPAFRFDTQFTDRERQCLVAGDGSSEVRDDAGTVVARHDFADREVCEHEELRITDDLGLEWVD
nr:hypothetical protein [uncultured Nocardioides sp.]